MAGDMPVSLYELTDGSLATTSNNLHITNCTSDFPVFPYNSLPYTTWSGWPVYVTTDKTKKAIDILKTLQAEKMIKCDSVPRFIELVEKISGLL